MSSASGLLRFFSMKQGKIRNIEDVVLTSPPMISRLRNVNVSKKPSNIPFFFNTPPIAQWVSTPSETKYWFQVSDSQFIFDIVDELMWEKQCIKMCGMGPM